MKRRHRVGKDRSNIGMRHIVPQAVRAKQNAVTRAAVARNGPGTDAISIANHLLGLLAALFDEPCYHRLGTTKATRARNLKQNNRVPDTASDLTYKGTRLQLVFTVEDEGVFTMGRSLMSAQEWHGRKTSAPRTYLNFSRRKIKLSFRREQAGFLKVGSSLWCEPACGHGAAASGLTDLPRTPQIRPVTSALCRKHQARRRESHHSRPGPIMGILDRLKAFFRVAALAHV
jgi:hypothetical protein